MKRSVYSALVLAAILAVWSASYAAGEKDSKSQAIESLGAAYRSAFADGNAEAIAKLFTENGDLIDATGRMVEGREAIEKDYEGFFAVHGKVHFLFRPVSLKFLDREAAVVDGMSQASPPMPGPPVVSHYTVVVVKKDGKWLIQSLRERMSFPPSHYEKLKPLEWLVGSWSYGGGNEKVLAVRMKCKWSLNKNYLIRTHELDVAGQGIVSGTQRIGWDPAAKTIRSWLFTSTGDTIQGVWKKDGDRWIIRSEGVLANGQKVSSTNIITLVDGDEFTFQSTDRKVDGEPEPDIELIEVRRSGK